MPADLQFNIGVDVPGFIRGIREAAKAAAAELDKLETVVYEPGVDATPLQQLKKEARQLQQQLASTFDAGDKSAQEFFETQKKALAALSAGGKKGTAEWKAQVEELKRAEAQADRYEQALRDVDGVLQQTGSKKPFNEVALGAAAAGMVVGEAAEAFNNFTKPSKELDYVTAQLRTLGPEAAGMADSLKAAALEMSTSLPFAASEIQGVMFDAMASGVKGGEEGLKVFADTAAQLAVGGGAEIGEATQLLAGQLNAYGASSEEATRYADVFFNTVNFGVTTVKELSSTLANVVPTAAGAGIEIENVGAALAVMTQKGVPTAQSTTKLNQLLIELQKPASTLAPILKAAGVSLESLKNDDLPVTLGKVKKAIEATGGSAIQFFSSSEAAAAFQTLTGDMDLLNQTFLDVRDTTGSAANAYGEMSESVQVQTDLMKSQVEAFMIGVVDKIPVKLQALSGVASEFAPMAASMGGAIATVGSALPGLESASKWLDKMKGDGGKLTDVFKNMGVSLGTLGKAAGIGALAALLFHAYQNSESFRESVDGIMGALGELAQSVLSALTPLIEVVTDSLGGGMIDALTGVLAGLASALAPVVEVVAGVLASVVEFLAPIVEALAPVILGAGAAVAVFTQWGAIIGVVAGTWGKLLSVATSFVGSIAKIIAGITAQTVATGAQAAATGVATGAMAALNAVMNLSPVFLIVTGIGLLVGAFAIFSSSSEDVSEALEGVNEAAKEANKVLADTKASDRQQDALLGLADSYDKLAGATDPAKQEEFKNATARLADAFPAAVDGAAMLKGETKIATDVVRSFANSQKELNAAAREGALAKLAIEARDLTHAVKESREEVGDLTQDQKALQERLAELEKQDSPYAKMAAKQVREQLQEVTAELGEQAAKLKEGEEQTRQSVKTLHEQGMSYAKIAKELDLTEAEAKAYHQQLKIAEKQAEDAAAKASSLGEETYKAVDAAKGLAEQWNKANSELEAAVNTGVSAILQSQRNAKALEQGANALKGFGLSNFADLAENAADATAKSVDEMKGKTAELAADLKQRKNEEEALLIELGIKEAPQRKSAKSGPDPYDKAIKDAEFALAKIEAEIEEAFTKGVIEADEYERMLANNAEVFARQKVAITEGWVKAGNAKAIEAQYKLRVEAAKELREYRKFAGEIRRRAEEEFRESVADADEWLGRVAEAWERFEAVGLELSVDLDINADAATFQAALDELKGRLTLPAGPVAFAEQVDLRDALADFGDLGKDVAKDPRLAELRESLLDQIREEQDNLRESIKQTKADALILAPDEIVYETIKVTDPTTGDEVEEQTDRIIGYTGETLARIEDLERRSTQRRAALLREFVDGAIKVQGGALDEAEDQYKRFGDALARVFRSIREATSAVDEKVREDLNRQREYLREQLVQFKITGQEFVRETDKLNAQLEDAADGGSFWDTFAESGKAALRSLREEIGKLANEAQGKIDGEMSDALTSSIKDLAGVDGAAADTAKSIANAQSEMGEAFAFIGAKAGASFADILASSENVWEDTKKLFRDVAAEAIRAFIPQIAGWLSFLGPFAVPAAVLAGEALAAAVKGFQFYDGGFTGKGNPHDVAGIVHKEEWVHTAKTVRTYGRDVMEAIHRSQYELTPEGHMIRRGSPLPTIAPPPAVVAREQAIEIATQASGNDARQIAELERTNAILDEQLRRADAERQKADERTAVLQKELAKLRSEVTRGNKNRFRF